MLNLPSPSSLEGQSSAMVACKLLELEMLELREALNGEHRHLVLDEVCDVIFRAREVAASLGITESMLDEYTALKNCVRTRVGKNKSMELHIAQGIISSSIEL